ncbi:MAG: malto-oligosyltrehalose trehalohydrolase [Gammaproteobacteria bacterium]|nr:malto-oligosyltrehalose trehalohydrolase [Gammaproteobacteria bacterium]
MQRVHEMPFGAAVDANGTRFRIWAPTARTLALCTHHDDGPVQHPLAPGGDGWYQTFVPGIGAGTRYSYLVDGQLRVPDPASRRQCEDVHGPSEIVDPRAFDWRDGDWRGRPWAQAVVYELHVGSFTAAGDFAGVETRLAHLAALGVTAVELMPVADFPGTRIWGYDGVLPYAPDASYGRPDDLKRLVQSAHAHGLMVLLDVVYNHFGPDGNYLHAYAQSFFDETRHTPWGAAIDFSRRPVREFFIHNALYWLEEYHFDGLRLDAVHAIADDTDPDILDELAAAVAAGPGADRHVHLVLENDANEARYLRAPADGRRPGYVAQWNDDIHHALHVLVTGERYGYYADYADAPVRHLGRCLAEGFAWQGEPSPYRHGAVRGEPSTDLPPAAFVGFLQNHDQIGNRAFGERITRLAAPEAVAVATAVLLLAPQPPLLFMGQEWGCTQLFPFFCDFGPELARAVTEGRRREFERFPEFADARARERIPDPNAAQTFAAAVLDWDLRERPPHAGWLEFHRELLALRRHTLMPHLDTGIERVSVRTGAHTVLDVDWRFADGSTLALIANLGAHTSVSAANAGGRVLYAYRLPADWHGGTLAPWSLAWLER